MKIPFYFSIVCHHNECAEVFATLKSKSSLIAVWNHSAGLQNWVAAPSGNTYCPTHWATNPEPQEPPAAPAD